MENMYSAKDAARELGVSKQQVFNYIKDGLLPAQYINGRAFLPKNAVHAFTPPRASARQRPAQPPVSPVESVPEPSKQGELLQKIIPLIATGFTNIAERTAGATSQGYAQVLNTLLQSPEDRVQALYNRIATDPIALSDEIIDLIIPEGLRMGLTPEELQRAKEQTRELAPAAAREAMKRMRIA